MSESIKDIHQLSFLEKLFDELLRPLPTRLSIQVSDLRGGQISCQIVRTPPPIRSDTPPSTPHTE
jgi:hypothetical protein